MEPVYGFDSESTKDIAETTRRVLRQGSAWSVGERVSIGGRRSVAVELLADMDADDTEAKPAKLMELAGGSWRDTKQRVDVRNVGSTSLGSGTRCMAWPVANLGLCVSSGRGGELQTLNLGIMQEFQDALQSGYASGFFTFTPKAAIAGLFWPTQFPAAVIYDGLAPDELDASTFALNYKKPLHVVCVGATAAPMINVTYLHLAGDQTAKAEASVAACWTPSPDSETEAAIDAYLSGGGTVLMIAEPPVTLDNSGTPTTIWAGSLECVDRLNTWLSHVGSETRIVSKDDAIPRIDLNLGGQIWADIALLPMSGVVSCNPSTWLGRVSKMPRIVDCTRRIQYYEFDILRNGQLDGFYENNGPWYGSNWYPPNQTASGLMNTNPFTHSGHFLLDAPSESAFIMQHVGTDAWQDAGAFPSDTHSRSYYLNAQIKEGVFFYRRNHDLINEFRNVQARPMATAELLPGGGKLIVTTRHALPWVVEALSRQQMSESMLDLTSQHRISSTRNVHFTDHQDHHVSFSHNGTNGKALNEFTRIYVQPSYSEQFVKGAGVDSFTPLRSGVPTSGRVTTIDQPNPDPVQYLAASDINRTGWTGFGGTSIWQRISTKTPVDSGYGYSKPGSAARLAVSLEKLRQFSTSEAVTLRVRAASCESDGQISGSGGSCDLTIRIVPGRTTDDPEAMTETFSLTGEWQTFERVLSAGEATLILENLAYTQAEFIPSSSGLGAAISWLSLETAAPETFPALIYHVDRRLYPLSENVSQSPYYHTWKGVHPEFGGNHGTTLYQKIEYALSDLQQWGHEEQGLLVGLTQYSPGYLEGSAIGEFAGAACGITVKYGTLVVQNGKIVSRLTVRTPASSTNYDFDGFPVVFQNNRFLRPRTWITKRDVATYAATGTNGDVAMWNKYRGSTSLKGWEDITHWPDIPDDLVDIETGPNSPPVNFGSGGEVEMPYGVRDPNYITTLNLVQNVPGLEYGIFNIVTTNSNGDVRAAWADAYL